MAKAPNGGSGDEEVIRMTSELIAILAKDQSILEGIKNLLPNLDTIQSARDRHISVFRDYLAGDHAKEEELLASRKESILLVNLVRGAATLIAPKDPTIPQRLGIVHQAPVNKRTAPHLGSPKNLRIIYEGRRMVARAGAVKGTRIYEVWCCDGDPMVESNWRHLVTSSKASGIAIEGLTPGKLYYFRIRAISASGPGDWSSFVSMIAI